MPFKLIGITYGLTSNRNLSDNCARMVSAPKSIEFSSLPSNISSQIKALCRDVFVYATFRRSMADAMLFDGRGRATVHEAYLDSLKFSSILYAYCCTT